VSVSPFDATAAQASDIGLIALTRAIELCFEKAEEQAEEQKGQENKVAEQKRKAEADRDVILATLENQTTAGSNDAPLVLRNQVRLTLGGARKIIAAAEAKAVEMKLKVNIAVVDDGGHMIAFARMDGARPASGYTATTKAATAATFRQASGPVPAGKTPPDILLNLSLQNAAAASGGKLTTLYGGVPVIVDQQVIGGVGVGGGSGEQDATIARAGIDALLKEIGAVPVGDKK
jgi:glc operon protein GlcG